MFALWWERPASAGPIRQTNGKWPVPRKCGGNVNSGAAVTAPQSSLERKRGAPREQATRTELAAAKTAAISSAEYLDQDLLRARRQG